MADSDNSRTLSTVTRGDFHSPVATTLPTYPEVAPLQNPGFCGRNSDLALAAWHQWSSAWQRLGESTAHQQRLETTLFSGNLPGSGEQVGSGGYNEALEEEDRAEHAEELAAKALWQVRATSVAGAWAKLDVIVHRSQPSPTSPDEPWPQLRAVMDDLRRIEAVVDQSRGLAVREREPALQGG
ncbi:MAG TPA: hypothetical protein VGO04_11760 [Ensifer sp.]|jgi:hypothetical protein|uniref:hypothetical protein n=1 Tax=Ensifer sp. TaxID=1872086 RepID=UPI002E0D31BF|nr:hypothetical protein [Ensifer sp.]